ncbi:unnamed protein product [Dracunculus medinensis]|uniref:RRM domain-containing protein n=1 Tax=Dracunculus medinensis TaxID=318479 RepID=A0A0N4U232_DRAME|nr:unnamed protein product [Dracunculus medinensis]
MFFTRFTCKTFDRGPKVIPEEGPYKAFVGNLPYDCIREVRMMRDHESDRFKGFAYVEFGTKSDLQTALELNGTLYGGQALRVDIADAPRSRDGRGSRVGPRGSRGAYNRGSSGGESFRSGRGNFDNDSYRGGNRGNFIRGRRAFRGRRSNADSEFIAHPNDPTRPRLNLQPPITDPEELERRRKKDEEETKRRQAHIFGLKE